MILSEGSVNKTEYSEAWLRSYIRDTYPCVVQRIQPFDLCIQDPVAYEFFSGIPVMILILELALHSSSAWFGCLITSPIKLQLKLLSQLQLETVTTCLTHLFNSLIFFTNISNYFCLFFFTFLSCFFSF